MLKLLLFLFLFAINFSLNSSRIIDDDIIDLSQFGLRIFGRPVKNNGKSFKSNENPEEQGPYLEGDLLVPSSDKNGLTSESYRWRNGEIPFQIDGNFSELGYRELMSKSLKVNFSIQMHKAWI